MHTHARTRMLILEIWMKILSHYHSLRLQPRSLGIWCHGTRRHFLCFYSHFFCILLYISFSLPVFPPLICNNFSKNYNLTQSVLGFEPWIGLWWKKWHWYKFFFEYSGFSLSVSFYQFSILTFIHLPFTELKSKNTGSVLNLTLVDRAPSSWCFPLRSLQNFSSFSGYFIAITSPAYHCFVA